MDLNRKLKIELEITPAAATMVELVIQEFVRNGGKLGDGLSVNQATREELLYMAENILGQISLARNSKL